MNCEMCANNRGDYCLGEACKYGDAYKPFPKRCRCSGLLSEVREHNGIRYRYCYSCHFEFKEEDDDNINSNGDLL